MRRSRATMRGIATTALMLGLLPGMAAAQRRLVGGVEATTGVITESWTFPAASALGFSGARQFTVPISAVVPVGANWNVDAYAAYANGSVKLASPDAQGHTEYALSGLTDLKLRVVGRIRGEGLLLTAGLNLPTGKTGADTIESEASGVLASPALRFRTPALGTGMGATTGIVMARETHGWALGFAGSLEYRGSYSPAAAAQVGLGQVDLSPGHAVHLSFAGDRVSGDARRAVNLIADFYTTGEVRTGAAGTDFHLGPSITATYQHQLGTHEFQSSLYVLERYRSAYQRGGKTVAGSSRSETEAGVQGFLPIRPSLGARMTLDARVHTNSLPDATIIAAADPSVRFANAGLIGLVATVALPFQLQQGRWAFEPFLRAQAGRLDLGGDNTSLSSGGSAGLTFTARF